VPVSLSVAVSQIEANVDLEDSAFTLEVPPGTEALTLEELRQAGPLRERR
jgi:outer membrane lipoprotein-sorting protein